MSADLLATLQRSLGTAHRIERELGGGGMSRVFVAEDLRLRRRVVVKVLSPELLQGFSLQRFEREIQTAAGLQQANIVGVLSAGEADGLPYYMMPYVDGESLRALLAHGPLAITEVVSILRDVAKALAYAHRQGVVHRDIKPDNVLLSSGTAVVTDFGIAKAISAARTQSDDTGLTQAGMSIGTPAYMAPEQAAGDPNVDHRADLYSLGAMAYELLAGRQLFADRTPQRMLAAHLSEQPVEIASLRHDVPPALGALVMRLLLKDPDARVQSAAEVVQQLDAVTSAAQVTGAPASAAEVSATFGRALAIYVASFAAVMASTQVAINTIGLPDWVFSGAMLLMALGLPIVLWTGYVQRVAAATSTMTPGGTRTAPRGTVATMALRAAPQSSWSRTGRRGVLALTGFVGVVTVAMTLRALGIGPEGSLIAANKLAAHDKVVLADFVVLGPDSSLRGALTTALRTQLQQSNVVQIVQQSTVTAALQRMRLSSETSVTVPIARDVAQREGAKAVIAADAAPLGGGYLITENLIDAATGDVLASYAETAGKSDDLLNAIDAASRRLRGRMGESLKAVRAAPALAAVTTSSLEALKKYAQAFELSNNRGEYRQAIKLAEEAVALDPTFALAWRRLANDYGSAGMAGSLIDRAVENAYRFRDRLPPVERALVTGSYFVGGAHDNRAKAVERYAEALRLDSVTLHGLTAAYQLASLALERRDFPEAERFARLSRHLGPSYPAPYGTLVRALLGGGRADAAQLVFDSLRASFPGDPALPYLGASILANRRRYDSMPAFLSPYLAGAKTAQRSVSWRVEVYAATARGSLRAAMAVLDSIDAASGAVVRQDSAELEYARASMRLALEHETGAAIKVLDRVSAVQYMAPIPVWGRGYYSIAEAYARAGELAKAKALFVRAEASVTDEESRYVYQQSRHRALAEIALVEHRYSEALAEFRAADRLPDGPAHSCTVCLHGDLARVFDAAGQRDSAIAEFTAFHGTAGLISLSYDADNLAGSHKRLGELYEAKGDVKHAVEQYDKFVVLWRNADQELQPVVSDVRRRITRLTPVEPRR